MTLSLIGSNPDEKVKALACDHVEVTGYVSNEELARRYTTACLCRRPLRFGADIKLKVRFGVPVVTTPKGVQGLPEIADFVPVCSETRAFADAAINLLRNRCGLDPSVRCQRGLRGAPVLLARTARLACQGLPWRLSPALV